VLSRAGAAIGALVLLSVPRVPPTRARAAAVTAVGSTAARASGASRWPPSVVLAIGAAAAWPLCATLQRSFPTAVTVAAAAVAAAIAAVAPSTMPVLWKPSKHVLLRRRTQRVRLAERAEERALQPPGCWKPQSETWARACTERCHWGLSG
jgi:hypothetical protein